MRVELAFGSTGLKVEVPDDAVVVAPRHLPAAPSPRAAVLEALRHPVAGKPLRELVQRGQTIAISVCDGTRPQPRHIVVPAILDELSDLIDLDDVKVLIATGTHRGNSPEELHAMLGAEVIDSVRVENHDARNAESLSWVGTLGADVPVWLNREWLEADIRITTGFVEPHFFAGFSGGPKMVAPGLAGLDTVLVLHDALRIGDPRATWGIIEGNPVHEDVRAIAASTGVDYAVDVVLDREQRIVRAFGGELFSMHEAACALARATAMQGVDHRFDVVVTSNAGFPLDQNLYQAVKGMSAAAQVVRPGGTIVCAAECRDGFPDHGSFRAELAQAPTPEALLELIRRRPKAIPDQWQAQIQAGILSNADVTMHTSRFSEQELAEAHLGYSADVSETVAELVGRSAGATSVCVLPEGPTTIPFVT